MDEARRGPRLGDGEKSVQRAEIIMLCNRKELGEDTSPGIDKNQVPLESALEHMAAEALAPDNPAFYRGGVDSKSA